MHSGFPSNIKQQIKIPPARHSFFNIPLRSFEHYYVSALWTIITYNVYCNRAGPFLSTDLYLGVCLSPPSVPKKSDLEWWGGQQLLAQQYIKAWLCNFWERTQLNQYLMGRAVQCTQIQLAEWFRWSLLVLLLLHNTLSNLNDLIVMYLKNN